jgi:UDP-N-acetylmuramoyl-tripeptide--D-alanyl-D-alanine ligase
MEIEKIYQLLKKSTGITTDSRKIALGNIYFALKGESFDGNTFASNALNTGASYAIVDNPSIVTNERMVLVKDVLKTLQELATFHRRALGIPIVGITGTNGKTTTKELIKAVLSSKYKVWATIGNLNNHIGVPLTLLSMNEDTEIGIVEMGANHPLEIKQLCEIAEPDMGLITNIGKGHLDGFGGFEGVKRTKKELYDFLEKRKGLVFYNSDNVILSAIIDKLKVETLSYGPKSGILCKGQAKTGEFFLTIEAEAQGIKFSIETKLVGDYNLENVLAACAVGLRFNISPMQISEAISSYTPTNNRSQLFVTSQNRLLLDCYNANPSSTEAALQNFSRLNEPNKAIIIGDMLELGDDSEEEHIKILKLATKISDCKVFIVGPWYKKLSGNYPFKSFETSDELKEYLSSAPLKGHFILIKGSRGIKLEKIIDVL